MAHPTRMNWHIEKDGIIVAKGNGILKFAKLHDYYNCSRDRELLQLYEKDKSAFIECYVKKYGYRYNSKEEAIHYAEFLGQKN
jgi:hypothetical protein